MDTVDSTVPRPRAAIVVTGSELLTGTIADANGPWLARRLTDLGLQVTRLLVVGDRPADLMDALDQVADCALVVTSGGLGPTADDLTVECVARFAAHSPLDTAPGLVLRRPDGPLIAALPGPPRELQSIWPAVLAAPEVRELLSSVPAPGPGHPDQRVSADGRSTDELLARALLDRGWWVATAESCTGGQVVARLVDRPGSSAYVAGGTVAYSNEAKVSQLDVSAETLAAHGAVSPQVARELADGARRRFGAAIGVGVTGVAGPDGGTATKPVGYVCFCVTTDGGAVLARDPVLPGGRAEIRDRATDLAMHLLLQVARDG